MGDNPASGRDGRRAVDLEHPLAGCDALTDLLYAQSGARDWGLPREKFVAALERSIRKRFSTGALLQHELKEYLDTLHLVDLALACACCEACDAAWEYFVATYRGYLRAAARSILRGAAGSEELADSLFADLYGLTDDRGRECSLFRYFHGRSALKTWLRAVLAQRHVDAIRGARRFESLPEEEGETGKRVSPNVTPPAADPHRHRYMALFTAALESALEELVLRDRERLRLYYAEQQTLAEIGRLLGEHESSVSRNLERVRRELRSKVEEILRSGRLGRVGHAARPGLSDAEIALCLEYAAADAPIDLDKLFSAKDVRGEKTGRQER